MCVEAARGALLRHQGPCGSERFTAVVAARNDLHRTPVVGEFLAAVEAHNVRAGSLRGGVAALAGPHRDGEAVVFVPATEESINQSREHSQYPFSCAKRVCAGI